MTKSIIINKKKLLLVEGSHEEKFFEKLLQEIKITDIQVAQVGGQFLFATNIKNLPRLQNFNIVESIGVVRDADDGFTSVFQSIQESLQQAGLPVPNEPLLVEGINPKVSIFIMPDNKSEGALEKLCLISVNSDSIMECVDSYIACIEPKLDTPHVPTRLDKAKVQVYLAKDPDGDIHMGIAAQKDIWNWNDCAFDDIKEFIKKI